MKKKLKNLNILKNVQKSLQKKTTGKEKKITKLKKKSKNHHKNGKMKNQKNEENEVLVEDVLTRVYTVGGERRMDVNLACIVRESETVKGDECAGSQTLVM